MEYTLKAQVHLKMNHEKGSRSSTHVTTDYNLEVSKGLDKKMYLDNDGLPTKLGSHCMTVTLIAGLVGNIQMAHQKGFRDSAEHLRYVITELERGVFSVANVSNGTFDEG